MALMPPTFLDCVVAIGYGNPDDPYWGATGFIYGKRADAEKPIYTIALVTNEHVVRGADTVMLRFNPKSGAEAQEFVVNLLDEDGNPVWSADPEVDLAVVAIRADQLNQAGIQYEVFRSDRDVATLAQAEELGLSEGDGLFILGFPLGLVGEQRNYVIVRQGAVARIRDTYRGVSKDFLADVPVFPGNSGGPVVTRPEITKLSGTKAVQRALLIGVVWSYLPYEEVAISQQTQQPRVTFQENSGLSCVIPVDHIIRLFEMNLEEWERRGVATVAPVVPE